MSSKTLLDEALTGVNMPTEAAQLYAHFPVLQKKSLPLPSAGQIKRPWKPQPKNSIIASIYWPHVLASHCLTAWSTPATLSFHSSLNRALPPSDSWALLKVMLFSLDEQTQSNYGAGLLHLTQYCNSWNIPEVDWSWENAHIQNSSCWFHNSYGSRKSG